MSPIKGQDNQLCARLYSLFPSLTALSFSVINLSLTVGIVPMSIHIFPGYSSIKTCTRARTHARTHTDTHTPLASSNCCSIFLYTVTAKLTSPPSFISHHIPNSIH